MNKANCSFTFQTITLLSSNCANLPRSIVYYVCLCQSIKTDWSVFGDRSKLPIEPTHLRTLRLWLDYRPHPLDPIYLLDPTPTFWRFSECVFQRFVWSFRTDSHFRTHTVFYRLYYVLFVAASWRIKFRVIRIIFFSRSIATNRRKVNLRA
jgi:hypothetical protein